MKSKKKWLANFLIILGLLVALFPLMDRVRVWYWQEKLLSAYEEDLQLEIESPQVVESDYMVLQSILEAGEQESLEGYVEITPLEGETVEQNAVVETTTSSAPKPVDKSVIGKIKISKINVNMPILNDATERNLNRGAAFIAGTSEFGTVGNVGVAAHRGRSYGVFFNRLNELEPGDIIEVTTNNTVYKYTVYKVHIVEPTEVSVLNRNKTDKILTLVTCDPVKNPTHRLIVHALQNP